MSDTSHKFLLEFVGHFTQILQKKRNPQTGFSKILILMSRGEIVKSAWAPLSGARQYTLYVGEQRVPRSEWSEREG